MTLYLPVGPPASGKSTLAVAMKDLGIITDRMIVSPDEIREWMTNNRADQTVNRAVFEIVEKIATARLERGLSVFLDATNLTDPNGMLDRLTSTAERHKLDTGPAVEWIVMDTTPTGCRIRNANRYHPVPDHVMDRMIRTMSAWKAPRGATVKQASDFLYTVRSG